MTKVLGIVRVRGTVKVPGSVKTTLERLRLGKRNSMAIYYDSASLRGMLRTVEPYVAWGELTTKFLEELLEKRGRVAGGKRVGPQELNQLGFESVHGLAESIGSGGLKKSVEKGLRNVFGLTPPTKGYKGKLRKPVNAGGVWGEHKEGFEDLVRRMM